MIYLRYCLVFLVIAVGVGLIVALLNETTQTTLGSSAQLMVPAMVAALIEGHRFARAQTRSPTRLEKWRFVWIATGLAVLCNLLLGGLATRLLPEFGRLMIAPPLSRQFLLLLGIYAGGYLICNWLFFGLGTSTERARREDGR